eukprot:2110837-Prymnesium_polylepis.1
MVVDRGAWGGFPTLGRWGGSRHGHMRPHNALRVRPMGPWVRVATSDQYRGDKVQGDCVVGREFLEGPVFGCPGMALAVQCGW